jgi:hypothetical protein
MFGNITINPFVKLTLIKKENRGKLSLQVITRKKKKKPLRRKQSKSFMTWDLVISSSK